MAVVGFSAGAWTPGFAAGDLNALANGSLFSSSLVAPQIDNANGANLFVQIEVSLAAFSPTAGANILVSLIPESATLNTYMTGSDGATIADQYKWQNYPYAILALRTTAASPQVQRSQMIQIAPERYKLAVVNRAGVALAATGNQVLWRLIAETVV